MYVHAYVYLILDADWSIKVSDTLAFTIRIFNIERLNFTSNVILISHVSQQCGVFDFY